MATPLQWYLVRAESAADMDIARIMFREYQQWLGVDLCFQDFDAELAGLPGGYAAPRGAIYLAVAGSKPIASWAGIEEAETLGCVAVKPLENPAHAEMKRLYVRDAGRGAGLGRRLAEAAVDFAAEAGYRAVRLDTLKHLHAAIGLYHSMGFRPIEAYVHNPLDGVLFMEKRLP